MCLIGLMILVAAILPLFAWGSTHFNNFHKYTYALFLVTGIFLLRGFVSSSGVLAYTSALLNPLIAPFLIAESIRCIRWQNEDDIDLAISKS